MLIDTYVNVFNCDGCSKKLVDESWFTCVPCASSYFSSFDLCSEVNEKKRNSYRDIRVSNIIKIVL